MPCFYLTPKQDDFNQELQVCIAEALYDVIRTENVEGPDDLLMDDQQTVHR